jgi:hypothetical protein
VAAATATRTRLVLIGPGAEADRAALLHDAPGLAAIADVEAAPCDPCDDAGAIPADAGVAFVCHPDEAVGLAWGAAIGERMRGPVLVEVAHDGVLRSLDLVGVDAPQIHPVGAAQRVLGPSLLLDTANESIARARHDAYLRLERAEGRGADPNPSLVPWDALPEPLKESNRRFADSVGAKAAQLGGRIVPLAPAAPPAAPLELTGDLMDALARTEHERWVRDLRADGWEPTTDRKDPAFKRHPLIVDWDALSDAEREKDRDSIRELPRLLAAAGYALVPTPSNGQYLPDAGAPIVAAGNGSMTQ